MCHIEATRLFTNVQIRSIQNLLISRKNDVVFCCFIFRTRSKLSHDYNEIYSYYHSINRALLRFIQCLCIQKRIYLYLSIQHLHPKYLENYKFEIFLMTNE